MDSLVKKVSEYQIFNFLFPGTVFAAAVTKTTSIDLMIESLLVAIFVYYFIGLTISRVGSIMISPILKTLRIIDFAPYDEYIEAAKIDKKLDVLSQENNTYRTLIAAACMYLIVYIVDQVKPGIKNQFSNDSFIIVLVIALIVLLIFSYRKQTGFIKKRLTHKKD